jgi:serine/threonine protein kinase
MLSSPHNAEHEIWELQPPMSEIDTWSKWESQTVNGLYPLRHFVGRSNHSVVFQTEFKAQKAAIKLLPEEPAGAEAQLSRWQTNAALSHPSLIRILDTGRCKLGGHPFLYVVTEFAEQTLAQILPHRPLTVDETQELLGPALETLAYLHGRSLVQAALKPANFLVVDDRLKLAGDTIRSVGDGPPAGAKPSIYDAPEARTHAIETASDAWGLGVTLVEALTQSPPRWNNDGEIILPASLPLGLAETLRRCLSRNPRIRPTIAELQAQFTQGAASEAADVASPAEASMPAPVTNAPPLQATLELASSLPPAAESKQPAEIPATKSTRTPAPAIAPAIASVPGAAPAAPLPRWLAPAAVIGLLLLLIIWIVIRSHGRHDSASAIADPGPSSIQQPATPVTLPSNPPPPARPVASPSSPSAIVHQEIPIASRSARDSIHGTIKVAVLVTVDRAGAVVSTALESHGPSKYFARLAADAAKRWRFTPTEVSGSRQWLVLFEFTRSGAEAQIEPRGASGHAATRR